MNERIKKLLEILQMSPSEIATKLAVQRSTFSHLLSGRNKPSYDFITSFLTEFPHVNPDYLLLGKLPILRGDTVTTQSTATTYTSVNKNELLFDTEKEADPEIDVPNTVVEHTTDPTTAQTEPTEQKIESIVHFYSDGTFKVYRPL